MRIVLVFTILVTSLLMAQFIENSCTFPCENITGITEGVYAVDSLLDVIYHLNGWSGNIYDTIPIPWDPCSPVGLAIYCDTLMFAESGTALIRTMTVDGDSIGTYDFSVFGIESISGLSCGLWMDYLWIMDDSTNIVHEYRLPFVTGELTYSYPISDCPQVHDIAMTSYGFAIACEDPTSPVRIYESGSIYYPIYDNCQSAVGVGTCAEGNRFWFTDPDMGMIHRYCIDMGGTSGEEPGQIMELLVPNPVSGNIFIQMVLPYGGNVSVAVTDIAGRLMIESSQGWLDQGTHQVPLELEGIPAGTYLMKVNCSGESIEHTFTILPPNK